MEIKSFEILLRRRIPYVSKGLLAISLVCFVILFLLDFIMIPVRNVDLTIKTAYFILVVPDWLKTVAGYSFIGIVICTPLYYQVRLHKPGIVEFLEDGLTITTAGVGIEIPYRNIEKVYLNELRNFLFKPNGTLQIAILHKKRKTTTFRLKNPEDGEEFMSMFVPFDKIQLGYANLDMMSHD